MAQAEDYTDDLGIRAVFDPRYDDSIGIFLISMNIRRRRLELITYDNGDAFELSNFTPIKNRYIKPLGGLWASPINSHFGWREWCQAESFSDFRNHFTFVYQGNVMKIDGPADMLLMPWIQYGAGLIEYPDYEQMVQLGIEAIWLTENGGRTTRFSYPRTLYGWDCESVLIMNPNGISESVID